MSAYASLPGSLLPFFAFGTLSSSPPDSKPTTDGVDTTSSLPDGSTQRQEVASPTDPSGSLNDISPSCAFKALVISSDADNAVAPARSPASASSHPSDIIIAIRSARVDPVELIKTLTSRGSNIARRTANFIAARTPSATADSAGTEPNIGGDDASADKRGVVVDGMSNFSRPGLCLEDTDSDEEYSMYDYSDDFSSQNDDEKDCDSHHDDDHPTGSDGDTSAIEFQLSITFQGRKYNATRAFPTFVKLREDLMHELKNNDRRSKRSIVGTKILSEISDGDCTKGSTVQSNCKKSHNDNVSVPELPRVSPESLGHGGYALSGVARSGFALLQATAQHYCPEMERWMRQVIDTFPCSQSLSRFLWEPLSKSSDGWETNESNTCDNVGQKEEISPLREASAFAKPPLHTRGKPKSGSFSKISRFKSNGSFGSLDSIKESTNYDCDDDGW
ncbi:hypothetical protein ACHAXA_010536 [Cyclostephanos tholiformis]|jgi:hypothetical protein|uniref:Uncharacterized protein n=1 Tax=Cyclostephanos tholiformis TaxID=382380 RepID=A0ABD3SPT9_9STRA